MAEDSADEPVYRYALLHPVSCTIEERIENYRVLGPRTLGIEVTVPALAARCSLGNIDPQHSGSGDPRAAIEVCLDWPLPPDGAWLVTIRPDLDALGSMAIFALRRSGARLDPALRARVTEVAQVDRFARGPWPGPRPLPRKAAECAALIENGALGRAAAVAFDHRLPIGERVTFITRWLRTGDVPARYHVAVKRRAGALARALASGALRLEMAGGWRIAVVDGSAEGAVRLGYLRAPVVIALNPAFRFRGGPPQRKFTVCQWAPGYLDLGAVAGELSRREPGWGGSETIIGSPQGRGSILQLGEVLNAVVDALS